MCSSDTSPEMQKLLKEKYKRLTGEERMLLGFASCRAARRMVLSSFPAGLSAKEIKVRLFLRYYSSDFSEEDKKKIIQHLENT